MSDKKNPVKVSVDIFDEEYVVKGDENRDYIEMLASYVDRRMRLIHQRNPNLSATKIAVLTALNLADELNKLQEDYDELVKKMEHNSPENVRAVFDKYFNQEMTGLLKSNMDFYKRVVDNEKLRDKLKLALFDLLYEGFEKSDK